MLIFTAYSPLITAEMCIPYSSSEKQSSYMFWQCVNIQHQLTVRYLAVKYDKKKIQQKPHSKKTKTNNQTNNPNNSQKLTCRSVPWILFCRMQGLVESGSPSSKDSTVCGTSFTITNGTRARPDISRERYTGECPHLEKGEIPIFCHPVVTHCCG